MLYLHPDCSDDAGVGDVHDPGHRPHARVAQLGEVKDDEAVEEEGGGDRQRPPPFLFLSFGRGHCVVQLVGGFGHGDGGDDDVGQPFEEQPTVDLHLDTATSYHTFRTLYAIIKYTPVFFVRTTFIRT